MVLYATEWYCMSVYGIVWHYMVLYVTIAYVVLAVLAVLDVLAILAALAVLAVFFSWTIFICFLISLVYFDTWPHILQVFSTLLCWTIGALFRSTA